MNCKPITTAGVIDRESLLLAVRLLLLGQLFYIVVTLLHTGGEANNHHAIFAAYARSASWAIVHFGQFVSMAIFLAGLIALYFALEIQAGASRWAGRFGAVMAAATLPLYGALQAVDGVALKQVVNAWANAPDAEKAARFAGAEAIRWLEWGLRSYQNFALGFALLLFALALARTSWAARPVIYLMGLSGLTYLAQGWLGGTQGFSQTHALAIVLSWVLNLAWMVWLYAVNAVNARRGMTIPAVGAPCCAASA